MEELWRGRRFSGLGSMKRRPKRYVIHFNKQRPTLDISCRECKLLLKEFGRLEVRRGVLYRRTRVEDQVRHQVVLPKQFRQLALKCAHNDIGHLGRERGIHILRERFYWPRMNSTNGSSHVIDASSGSPQPIAGLQW